jgi:AraC-like DNA-binding protein
VRGRQGFMKFNMDLDFVDRSREGQTFSVVAKSFGSVGVGRIHGTPASFSRRSEHLADNRDLLSIIISEDSRFVLEGARGEGRYGAHGAAILESRQTSTLHSLDHGRAWTICMERAPIEPLLGGLREPLQRCVQGDNVGIRLLEGYLAALFSLERDCDPTLATTHIRDLVVHALGVPGDAQALVRERGVRAARLSAVGRTIAARAAEPGLDPEQVARQLGISERYLHRLLEPTGRSFAQHLLQHRLERAVAMLRDQGFGHLKIAEIAANAGFIGISHFNRSFRRAFGDTPYGVRARALRRLAQAV